MFSCIHAYQIQFEIVLQNIHTHTQNEQKATKQHELNKNKAEIVKEGEPNSDFTERKSYMLK